MKPNKILLVGFDGLRPCDITHEVMPNLARFREESHCWENYLASFPTETYVNHPVIFSGFRPCRHGIIANSFFNPNAGGRAAIFSGWDLESVTAQDAAQPEGLYAVKDMGELLAAHGRRLRILCSNSVGSTRLQHMHAARYEGHLNACIHQLEVAEPAVERERLLKDHPGRIPLVFPDFDAQKTMVDLFFDHELREGAGSLADVTVLWIGEPDHSSHELGLKSEATESARAHADGLFGRVLQWWRSEGRRSNVQLVTLSDHGHAEIAGFVDYAEILRSAGLNVVTGAELRRGAAAEAADVVIVGDYAAGLWVKEKSTENLARIARTLAADPGVGLVFSQPDPAHRDAVAGRVPGTLSEALVFSDNVRGPDLRVVGRGDNASGRIICGRDYNIGCGNHGGLTPHEVHAHLALAGSAFVEGGRRHKAPAGHDDLAKTLLAILGIALPASPARELEEAMNEGIDEDYGVFTLRLSQGRLAMSVEQAHYAGRRYVLSAQREDGSLPAAATLR